MKIVRQSYRVPGQGYYDYQIDQFGCIWLWNDQRGWVSIVRNTSRAFSFFAHMRLAMRYKRRSFLWDGLKWEFN